MYVPESLRSCIFCSGRRELCSRKTPVPAPADAPTPPAPAAAPTPGARTPSSDPQPYDKVITKDAKSATGVFTVHQVKDRYYYEIPKGELDKEFLLNVRVSKTTVGVGYGGELTSNIVVLWELNGNKVHLRDRDYSVTADPNTPIALAVKAANNDTILMTFPVAAFSKDGAPVIDVTRLFSTDVPEFNVRQRLNATAMDASRSYIERISPYPENVEAESTLTYTRGQGGGGAGAQAAAPATGMRPGSASVVLHYSMVKLPEKPMMPRLFDDRGRLLHHRYARLQQGRASRAASSLHCPLAARQEGSGGGVVRSGQADRVLH